MLNPWMAFMVLLLLCQDVLNNEHDSVYEPSWVYKCEDNGSGGCQRTPRPKDMLEGTPQSGVHYESISLCRTVCGKDGAIWPKPKTASLTKQFVQFHPTYLRFDFTRVSAGVLPLMQNMTMVASDNILTECNGKITEVVSHPVTVNLVVRSDDSQLTFETDESYTVDIKTNNTYP